MSVYRRIVMLRSFASRSLYAFFIVIFLLVVAVIYNRPGKLRQTLKYQAASKEDDVILLDSEQLAKHEEIIQNLRVDKNVNNEQRNEVMPLMKGNDITAKSFRIQKSWKSPPSFYNCGRKKHIVNFDGKERFIHLDLKGAPPKVSYFKKIFPLYKKMGATGLLIEYEDMFPYKDRLKEIALSYAYTETELQTILKLARENGLKTIPLVQTFGHMEYVLEKDAFKKLREQTENIKVISPTNEQSLVLIKAMISQVSRFHKDSVYFHIGSDEVSNLGKGVSANFMRDKGFTPGDLFLWHVKRVATYVKSLGYKVLMWDDMLRHSIIPQDKLKKSGLGSLIEPVIWFYNKNNVKSITQSLLNKYEQTFSSVWIAPAFKGGDGMRDYITKTERRVWNHYEWLELLNTYMNRASQSSHMTIKGAFVTGWQRFNHKTFLCELLPVAMPSLAFSLSILQHGCFSEDAQSDVSQYILDCDSPIAVELLDELADPAMCHFPGHEIYEIVQTLYCTREGLSCDLHSRFSNITKYNEFKERVVGYLNEIYYADTVDEWVKHNVRVLQDWLMPQ